MRVWFSGPRIAGVRTGVSFGREDLRALSALRHPAPPETGGFVYAIMDRTGRYKIGSSTDPISRLAGLQTAHADPLEIVYCVAPQRDYERVEKTAHDILAVHRINGEWFSCPLDSIVAGISVAASRLGTPIVSIEPRMIGTVARLAAASAEARQNGVSLSGVDYLKIAAKTIAYSIFSAVAVIAIILSAPINNGANYDTIPWLFAAIPVVSLVAAVWDTRRNKRRRLAAA